MNDIKRKPFKKKWTRTLEEYGFTEKDIIRQAAKLAKEWSAEASNEDVVWSLLKQVVPREAEKDKPDYYALKMLYHQMALFLSEWKKDFFSVLQESKKMELLETGQKTWAKKVKINSSNCCEACKKKVNGKTFTIEEALEIMPIPVKECSIIMNKGNTQGFCLCLYNIMTPDEYR